MSDHGEWKQRVGETIEAKGVETFVCPFCQLEAWAMTEPPGVGHALPPCKSFLAMDPITYLRAVNQARRQRN